MSLLGVELTRFRSRRAIVLLLLAGALLAGVLAGKTLWDSRPVTAADIATAQAQAQLATSDPYTIDELTKCTADPVRYLGPGGEISECHDLLDPSAEDYLVRQPVDLKEVLQGNGMTLTLLLIGLMVVAGCTFAGADWSSGSLENQLLFEPRRIRVWVAKALAVAIASGLVTLVILSGFWLTLHLTAVARETTQSGTVHQDVVLFVLRSTAIAIGAAIGSYALTQLFRHTVATLGILFVYSVGGEILVNLLPIEGVARWSLGNNVFAWLKDDFRYFDSTLTCPPGPGDCSKLVALGHLPAGVFLLALLALACVASVVAFRRRDL